MFSLCSAVATHQLPSQINTHSSLVRSQLCSSTKHQCVQTNHTQHLGNSSKWISLNINKLSKKTILGFSSYAFRIPVWLQRISSYLRSGCAPQSGIFGHDLVYLEDRSLRKITPRVHANVPPICDWGKVNNYLIQYSFVFAQVAIPTHCWS